MLTSSLLLVVLGMQAKPLPKLVGTLSVTEGRVRLERVGRDPQWAGNYERLRVGDKLTIVELSRATVRIDATREVWRLPEMGSWSVEDRALKKLTGLDPKLIRRSPSLRTAPGTPPQPLAGRIRGSDPQVWPFGAVPRGPVEVTWTKAPGSTKTTVELFNSKGKRLWTQKVSSGTKATVMAAHAKPGQWVRVQVLQSGSSPVSTSVWLCVMTPEQRQAVESSEKELRSTLANDSVALGLALGELWAESRMGSQLLDALNIAFPALFAKPTPSPELLMASNWQHGQWLEAGGFHAEARTAYERAWAAGERAPELKAAIERLGGKAEPAEWEVLAAERDRLMREKKFREALASAQKLVEILRKEKPDSLELAHSLYSAARNSHLLSNVLDAERDWNESLAICEKVAPGSGAMSIILTELGNVAWRRGDLNGAERRYQAALVIDEKLAPGSMTVAVSLSNLGLVAYNRGDLDAAQRRYEAALMIEEKLAPGSLSVADRLYKLGNLAYDRGDLVKAKSRHEAALAIREKLAPGSPTLAMSLNNVGRIAEERGDLEGAQRRYESALLIEENLAPASMGVARILSNLGSVSRQRGDLASAQRLNQAALQIGERLAPGSLSVANFHGNLGSVAQDRGDLEMAQRRFGTALAIYEKLAPGSTWVAMSLQGLGVVAIDRGDLDGAQLRFETALAIWEKLSPGSLQVADSLGNLGNVAAKRGDLDGARRWYEASRAIYEKLAHGSLHEGAVLTGLGVIARARGDLDEAQRCHEAALEIGERLAPGSLVVATSLNNLGGIAVRRGDLDEAQRRSEAALAIQEKFALDSLDVAYSLVNLVVVAAMRGDQVALTDNVSRLLEVVASLQASQGLFGAEESIANETSGGLRGLGLLANPGAFYPWLPTLRAAGITLRSRAMIAQRTAEGDDTVRGAVSAVQIATKQETGWATIPRPKEMEDKAWSNRLLDLRSRRQSAELKLATLLKEMDARLGGDLKVSHEAVQKGIAESELLIEYLRVSTWDDKAKKQGPDAYAAFIVQHEGKVRYVRLAPADKIDELVQDWQDQMAKANDASATSDTLKQTDQELKKIGRLLYEKLLKPLGKLPPNLLVAPDDKLHSLPFAALFDGKKYFVETKALSVVGSGRDLVEKPPSGDTKDAVVIAGPAFDLAVTGVQEADKGLSASQSGTRSINAKGKWEPLPAASDEGKAVAHKLGVEPILGEKATEARLMSVERPVVLHLATHGFFFPPIIEHKERDDLLMTDLTGRGVRVADSPMIRSGLILSGANNDEELRKLGLDDGWATSLELSQMDLRGTELVVLSACETGRGDVKGAEGVFGLQRAFRFAGAQTLVMSLFKVPDDSTRALMTSFYEKWKPGDPAGKKLKALRDTQLAMLKDPKTRHPRHWSGFVLMGER